MTPASTAVLSVGPEFIQPNYLLENFGFAGLLTVVFVECALLFGFFLPGDSLLFTAGLISTGDAVLAGHPVPSIAPVWLLMLTVPIAAIAGDQVGYFIGRKAGPAIFNREDSRFFKRKYVADAHEFFDKHGPKAIILARFVPIVRTFMPVTAGVAKMRYRTFVTYNIVGGVLWGAGVILLGRLLGNVDFVSKNIEAILLLIVALSVVPILVEVLRNRRASTRARTQADAAVRADAASAAVPTDDASAQDESGGTARGTAAV
ncbi:VTT domain-containing protein [Rhodococcus sp. X156]|uniref:DedA family protein n=1 Tax=Rhodococcus sp. X156 TaxID=2499145 RepID=UPI001F49E5A6|nr:VTT domain-containing protein [Rhodococcus sp. X156]